MTDYKDDSQIELEIRLNRPTAKTEVKLQEAVVKPQEAEANPQQEQGSLDKEKEITPKESKKFFDPFKITILVIVIATALIYNFTTGPNEVAFDTIKATKEDNTNYTNPDENKKPVEFTNESKEKGAQAFTETCGGCHSAFGKGLGSIALEPRIVGLSAEDILTTVKTSQNMFAVRHKPNLELIVSYLVKNSASTTGAKPSGQPNVIQDNDGKFFFYKACGKCHKVRYFGDGPEDLTKKAQTLGVNGILAAINNPPAEKMRLHLEGLTDSQKMAIAKYVAGDSSSANNTIRANEGGIGIYENNFCSQCHTINGVGSNVGPDLTHIGNSRNKAWLQEYLTNPKTVYPDTVMPVVPLTRDEIISLSEYLASLK